MFTIKHIRIIDGQKVEMVGCTEEYCVNRETNGDASIHYGDQLIVLNELNPGKCYIENVAGKTIDTFKVKAPSNG